MDEAQLNAIVDAVVKELMATKAGGNQTLGVLETPRVSPSAPAAPAAPAVPPAASLSIDLPDPTVPAARYQPRVKNPRDPEALKALMASTTARIGVGRSGPRYSTASLLLFQADHAVTQDAL